MKIKWKLIALLMALMAATAFVACGDGEDPEGPPVEPPLTIQYVDIVQEQLQLDRFESGKLEVKLTEITGSVTWTSSDDNIVSVAADGALIAKNVGTVTVTAAIGDKNDTCSVKVVEGSGNLEFADVRDVNLIKGESIELDTMLVYKNSVFTVDGLTVTFTVESGKDLISVDEFNILTAKNTLGTQKVTATAKLGGAVILEKDFTVTIYEDGLIETGIYANKITLVNSNAMSGSLNSFTLPQMTAKVDGKVVSNPISIEVIEGDTVIDLTGNTVTTAASGTAKIECSFTADSGEEYSTVVDVEVLSTATGGDTYFVQGTGSLVVSENVIIIDDGDVVVSAKAFDNNLDAKKVTSMTLNGEPINQFTVVANALKFDCGVLGDIEITATDLDGEVYTFETVAADCVIKTFGDLYYYMQGKKSTHTGVGAVTITKNRAQAKYVILTNDITSPTKSGAASTQLDSGESLVPQVGSTFNGNGYSINDVYTANGWFPHNKSIKNFTFKDITFNNLMVHKYSAFGYKLENCTFDNFKLFLSGVNSNAYTTKDYGGTSVLCLYPYNVTVKNGVLAFFVPDEYKDYSYKLGRDEPNKDTGESYYKTTLVDVELVTNANFALNGETSSGGYVTGAKSAITSGSTYTVTEGKDFVAKNDNGTAGYILTGVGGTSVELSKINIGTIERVVIGSRNIPFTLTQTHINTASTLGGISRYYKATNDGQTKWYKDTTTYADFAIGDFATFKAWKGNEGYKYIVITSNLNGDTSKGQTDSSGANTIKLNGSASGAIIDGLNHTIDWFYNANGLFGPNAVSVTIKNLNLTNFVINNYGIFGSGSSIRLENVTITAQDTGNGTLYGTGDYYGHMLFRNGTSGKLTMVDSSITFTVKKSDKTGYALALGGAHANALTLKNSHIVCANGTIAAAGEVAGNGKTINANNYTLDSSSSITDKDGKVA